MNQARVASRMAHLAAYCAKWAADTADLAAMEINATKVETVMRFSSEVRDRLLWIEREAYEVRNTPETATPGENISPGDGPATGR